MPSSKTDKNVQTIERFIKGEHVVLPSHGVGVFVEKEEKKVLEAEMICYKIHFSSTNMDVLIPAERLAKSGLRKLVSVDMANKVFDIISKTPKNQRGVWNKRMQEYDAKIYSGVLSNLAEVVRDGFICAIDSNKSYTERNKYKTALERVCSEMSIVLKQKPQEIEEKLIAVLKSVQDKSSLNDDEFDDEFNDIDSTEQENNEKIAKSAND